MADTNLRTERGLDPCVPRNLLRSLHIVIVLQAACARALNRLGQYIYRETRRNSSQQAEKWPQMHGRTEAPSAASHRLVVVRATCDVAGALLLLPEFDARAVRHAGGRAVVVDDDLVVGEAAVGEGYSDTLTAARVSRRQDGSGCDCHKLQAKSPTRPRFFREVQGLSQRLIAIMCNPYNVS